MIAHLINLASKFVIFGGTDVVGHRFEHLLALIITILKLNSRFRHREALFRFSFFVCSSLWMRLLPRPSSMFSSLLHVSLLLSVILLPCFLLLLLLTFLLSPPRSIFQAFIVRIRAESVGQQPAYSHRARAVRHRLLT